MAAAQGVTWVHCWQGMRGTVVEAARVAELEAAQSAAQAALMAEMELLRRQKAAAEEHSRRMEASVRGAHKRWLCMQAWPACGGQSLSLLRDAQTCG